MLIPSRYNIRAEGPGGPMYANTRSGVVVEVGADIDRFLQGREAKSPVAAQLAELGLAVDDQVDEVAEVVSAYEAARHDDTLALTVAPTVACNLRCEYCFETEHPNRYVDRAQLDAIVAFVKRQLAERRPSRFDVTWFGGEPLLHLGAIERLSRTFVSLASFNAVPYAATVVTNGTRLTPELAARLRSWRVLRAQITLDGGQRTHDLLRVDGRGRGSYDKVLAGVEACRHQLGVDLRIHADRRTARSVPALLDDLAHRGLFDVALTFARIEPPGVFSPRGPVDSTYLTGAEFAALELEWLERATALGFAVASTIRSESGPTPCQAVNPNHYVFEPGYRVERCYADVADDTAQDGTLHPDGTVQLHAADDRWRHYLPFDLGCAECSYLPLCVGGCPKARVDGGMHPDVDESERLAFKERYVCHTRKFNLPALLTAGLVT